MLGPRALRCIVSLVGVASAGCGQVPEHAAPAALEGQACWTCHGAEYLATEDPDHAGAALGQDCASCHTTAAWSPATYAEHDRAWPLTGAHARAACADCHAERHFTGTPRDCAGCHQPDYDATVDPDHRAAAYPTACAECHTDAAWRPAAFDHDRFWPLNGQHALASCAACHADARYAGTPTDCVGCHQPDYDATTDPDHRAAGYPSSCAACHDAAAWRPASYTGHDLFWPLEGRHEQALCTDCHAAGTFAGTPRDCRGCHQPAYDATTRPPHRANAIADTCASCHTPAGWSPAPFDAHDALWALDGRHAEASCASCHDAGVYAGTPQDCDACHHEDFVAAAAPDHVAATFPTACALCHSAAGWKPSPFDHQASWPLEGQHLAARCDGCHAEGLYAGTARACEACHQPDYDATVAPPHAAADLGRDCASCHTALGWAPAEFDHAPRWPLVGKHVGPTCADCHADGAYAASPRACDACHAAAYDAAVAPPHAAPGFARDCASCHTALGWAPAELDHAPFWPLTGRHLGPACADCHSGGVYAGTPQTCEGCHQPDYAATTAPPHAAEGFPTDCARCHTSEGWSPAGFDHEPLWPLRGQHAAAACAACHVGGTFAGTATECATCHQADLAAATEPDHGHAGFAQDCASCHTEAAWRPSSFDHTPLWPLTGRHRGASCTACHVNESYAGTPRTCAGCHQPDYDAALAPPHAADGYPTDCARCHTVSAWSPATFDHAAFWPLGGRHAATSCSACHAGGVFAGTANTCAACHLGDYAATTAPPHAAAGFAQDCASCHTEAAWRPSSFVHTATWPLGGRHAAVSCNACHAGGVFSGAPRACEGCHLADFAATTDPPHAAEGYPTDCARCHAPAGWVPNTFDHESAWPLRGQHTEAHCYDCHTGSTFAGTPQDCAACHQADYTGAQDPRHAPAGFAQDCASCHTESAWRPSSYLHPPSWPLSGEHAQASCKSCHQADVYAGTLRECEDCHLPSFLATTDPPHAADGYPTDCALCHSPAGWRPNTFDHESFWPLRGRHASGHCYDCHTNGVYAGTPSDCAACHQGAYLATTDPDHAAAAFAQDCAGCHTESAWRPATYTHPATWPLSGQHLATSCGGCHAGGVFAGTPTACDGCHHDRYLATTAPPHPSAGLGTNCATCHTPATWGDGTFDHASWPLTGAHAATPCNACHGGGVFAGTPKTCNACHGQDYVGATNPSHTALSLSTACQTCHATSSWDTRTFPVHDPLFPITTGKHRTFTCAQCHPTAAVAWSNFICTACHTGEHRLAEMNSEHADVGNYAATLAAASNVDHGCYQCHPTGQDD